MGDRARRNVPLGPLTTYRVGGPAALLTELSTEVDLGAVVSAVRQTGVPVLLVGRGSNLLVADAGFPGLAVTLGGVFAQLELAATQVRAGGAVSLPVLARRTAGRLAPARSRAAGPEPDRRPTSSRDATTI